MRTLVRGGSVTFNAFDEHSDRNSHKVPMQYLYRKQILEALCPYAVGVVDDPRMFLDDELERQTEVKYALFRKWRERAINNDGEETFYVDSKGKIVKNDPANRGKKLSAFDRAVVNTKRYIKKQGRSVVASYNMCKDGFSAFFTKDTE